MIVIDIGTLHRGITWKIGLNNINRDGWFGHTDDLDPDRPRRLGLNLCYPSNGQAILIATQHRKSLQAQGIEDMEAWVMAKIKQVRDHSDRDIVIRPHPRDNLNLQKLASKTTLQKPRLVADSYDSFDWSNHWHAVINHNSGPGVLAAIAGVRPIVDKSSLAWPMAVNMQDVESPYARDRDRWLIEIAHTEWTLDEILEGKWLKRLGSRL